MRLRDLDGKKVAIWGMGKDGESALRCLRSLFPDKHLTILSDQPIPENQRRELEKLAPVVFTTGHAVGEALCQHDVVIKSPGIPLYKDTLLTAKEQGTLFTSTANLFFAEIANRDIIAVTGTKGKSTTASIIHHCLLKMGVSAEICGNIGKPFLDFLEKTPQTDIWVAELSSYQTADLQPFAKIALLVNMFPEHLDWHGSRDDYFRDKLHLFSPGKDKSTIINFLDPQSRLLAADLPNVTYFNAPNAIHVNGSDIYRGDERLGAVTTGDLKGQHNHNNVCAALTALEAAGFDVRLCINELHDFRGLPHRQKVLGSKDGLTFVDDSISTTPESAIAAIERFNGSPLCLLLGGYDRQQNYHGLATLICKEDIPLVITLPGNGDRIADSIKEAKDKTGTGPEIFAAEDLASAVTTATAKTPRGGIVLLSPAAPSYGSFANFQERGQAFAKLAGL
jgi:UDP-N-acetylmuramoylalanine--D-glutamate ligase